MFGGVGGDRVRLALEHRLCGVCGRSLDEGRLVLLMRLSDVSHERSYEPGLHPVCAKYTIDACPMVAGRVERYRSAPMRLDDTMIDDLDVAERRGALAAPWFAVWVREYRVIIDHGKPAASYAGTKPLRVQPIGRTAAALLALRELLLGGVDETGG